MAKHSTWVMFSSLCLMLWGFLLYVLPLTIFADTPSALTPQSHVPQSPSLQQGAATSSFAQMVGNRSSIPVDNNHFVVDKGISEIEIILTTQNFKSIKLLDPQGKIFSLTQTIQNITWQRIENLYAIKVQYPAEGQWEIQGSMLSKPEVVVSSDLEMVTPDFPNNLLRGETLALSAYLQEKGQRITNSDILKHTQITASLQNVATNEIYKIYLKLNENAHLQKLQGLYDFDYHLETLPGIYILNIKAIGLLFQRERQQQFYLHDYPAKISTQVSAVNEQIQVDATIDSPVLDVSSVQLSAVFHNIDGSSETVMFDKKEGTNWQLLTPYNQDIDRMTIVLAGFLKDSRAVQVVFPIVNIESLYEKSYYELQQNLEQKSKKEWQKIQDHALAEILPYSIEKQTENLLLAVPLLDSPELKYIPQYPTYEQELLKTWQPHLYPKTAEDILGLNSDDKEAVLTKEQLQAQQLALEKAKIQQEKLAAFMHKKKIMTIFFGVLCGIFTLVLIAFVFLIVLPRKKKEEKPIQEEAHLQQATEAPPVKEEPKQVKKEEPKVKEESIEESLEKAFDVKEEEKPVIKEVINEAPKEQEPEVKEEAKEKEEIKMDIKEQVKEEMKEEIEDKVEETPTPPQQETPKGERPSV